MTVSKTLVAKIGISSSIALMTGLGMMPIFDDDIKSVVESLDFENSDYLTPFISINTLVIFSLLANFVFMHYFLDGDENDDGLNVKLFTAKGVAILAAMLPVSQLWAVELSNQEFVGSSGFDQYMAWATFTTLPVLGYESMICYSSLKNFLKNKTTHIELNSVGDKLFVYIPTTLSIPGRFVAYSYSTYFLAEKIGIPDGYSIAIGIVAGGVVGATVLGIGEYGKLKSLFEPSNSRLPLNKVLLGAVCAMEGVILTVPMVSTGMNAIPGADPLIKALLYSPLFISNTVLQGSNVYDAIKYVYTSADSYCCNSQEVTPILGDVSDNNLYEEIS